MERSVQALLCMRPFRPRIPGLMWKRAMLPHAIVVIALRIQQSPEWRDGSAAVATYCLVFPGGSRLFQSVEDLLLHGRGKHQSRCHLDGGTKDHFARRDLPILQATSGRRFKSCQSYSLFSNTSPPYVQIWKGGAPTLLSVIILGRGGASGWKPVMSCHMI